MSQVAVVAYCAVVEETPAPIRSASSEICTVSWSFALLERR